MNTRGHISRQATWRVVLSVFFVAFGIFLFVYGGYDDSPGAQLLGLLMVAFGVWRLSRRRK